jgi:hypothetical protein
MCRIASNPSRAPCAFLSVGPFTWHPCATVTTFHAREDAEQVTLCSTFDSLADYRLTPALKCPPLNQGTVPLQPEASSRCHSRWHAAMIAANRHRSPLPGPGPLRSACYLLVLVIACAFTVRNFSLAPTSHELPKPGAVASRSGSPATSLELLEVKDSYILYPATTATCGDAVILAFRATSSVHAARVCLANPNCTFFSVSSEGDSLLCSGRVPELIPSVGWSSGDRKGCEEFSVEDSRSFAAAAELPSCHGSSSAMHSSTCAYRNVATQKCLSDLIWLDRLSGVATQLQEHHICLNAAHKLEVSRQLLSTEQCAWRAHESSSSNVLTHLASNSRLVPDVLTHDLYTTSLKDRRTCLCGDVTSGLSVLHSCDSPSCRWQVGRQGAYLLRLIHVAHSVTNSNFAQGACIRSLGRVHASKTPSRRICPRRRATCVFILKLVFPCSAQLQVCLRKRHVCLGITSLLRSLYLLHRPVNTTKHL